MSRATLYRYLLNGLIPAVQFKGKTKIRRSSLEKIFDTPKQYQKHTKSPHTPITDFYTTAEVASKYGVNESWIFKVGKEQNIPKVFKRGKTYWSAKHFDKYFASKAPDSNITEWYSVEDLTEKFGMTTCAIYSFVSRFAIPKKKIKRQGSYSKKHVDIAKGLAKAEPEYYTTAEAMEKYNLTRDQLYHYVKWHHISKVQEGKYIKIKYITQLPAGQVPSFVFFCNLPQWIKEPYKRFLENKIRENWNFTGTPINVFIREK